MNVKLGKTQKDIDKALKQTLLSNLLDLLKVNFFAINKEGFYICKNSSLTSVVGEDERADVVNELAWNSCKKVMQTRIREEVEEEHNGRYFFSVKVPIISDNDEVLGVMGISIDITDRKHNEQLLCEKEIAEKLTKFSNLIAGSIAHEIRTPLTVISLQMDILDGVISSVNLPSEEEGTCRQIIKEVKQIVKNGVHVISDMLLKVRSFATGQLHHHDFVSSSIATDVEEFLASFPFEFDGEKELIKLTGFDSLANRFKYVGDHLLTQHVLSNLLRNALHAIRTEKKGNITIELQGGKNFNKLIFRDTASGIPADFVAKIFDQFETKKTTHGGTGLGLAFCKMVMQEYGGDIKCKSKEGEFTEFVLSFPNTYKK